ncbi:MAG: glycosyltransferase family 4 protein [Candidatus Diapherotrites archaeon]
MKLLLSHSNYSNIIGGVEVYAKYLKKVFSDLQIISYESLKNELGDSILPLFKEPQRARLLGKYVKKRFPNAEMVITNGMFSWNLEKIPQINVCHGTYKGFAQAAVSKTNIDFYRLSFVYNYFEKKAAHNALKVVSNSIQTQRLVKNFFELDSEIIYPPIDTKIFKPMNKEKASQELGWSDINVLFVGRPEKAKGFHLVEELAKLNTKINFRCVLSRPYQSNLKKLFTYGPIEHNQLPLYYNAADLILFPSLFEGFGIVAAEALACNKKVLSFETGFLTEPGFEKVIKSKPEINKLQEDFLLALSQQEYKLREKIKKKFDIKSFKKRWLGVVKK